MMYVEKNKKGGVWIEKGECSVENRNVFTGRGKIFSGSI